MKNFYYLKTDPYNFEGLPSSFFDVSYNAVKEYKFIDAYPTEVSAIELNFDTNNQVEEFTVTLIYNYWTSQSTAGNGAFGVGVTVNTPIGNLPLPVRIPGIN